MHPWLTNESGRDFLRRIATEVSSLDEAGIDWAIAAASSRFLPLVAGIGSSQARHAVDCVVDFLWCRRGDHTSIMGQLMRCPEVSEDDSWKREFYAGLAVNVFVLGLEASQDPSHGKIEKLVFAGEALTGELVVLAGEATSAEEEDAALRRLEGPFWARCLSAASTGDKNDAEALKRVVHEAGYGAVIDRAIQRKGWMRQPYR